MPLGRGRAAVSMKNLFLTSAGPSGWGCILVVLGALACNGKRAGQSPLIHDSNKREGRKKATDGGWGGTQVEPVLDQQGNRKN